MNNAKMNMSRNLSAEYIIPGIALGGGGALGLSHIGVLNALTHADIHFPIVSGTSMGAIIGAAYACGTLNLAENMARSLTRQAMRQWADLHWDGGLFKGDIVEGILRQLTRGLSFADLRRRGISLVVVACDLDTGEPVYIDEGDIATAVRASMSVPGLFVPVEINGKTLVDGGLVDNVPVDILHELGAGFTVAVNVSNSGDVWSLATSGIMLSAKTADLIKERIREITADTASRHSRHIERYHEVVDRIFDEKLGGAARESLSRLYPGIHSIEQAGPADDLTPPGKGKSGKDRLNQNMTKSESSLNWAGIKAILQSVDIMNEALEQERAERSNRSKPNILLHPNTKPFHAHQFYKAKELIEAGKEAARGLIHSFPDIKATRPRL